MSWATRVAASVELYHQPVSELGIFSHCDTHVCIPILPAAHFLLDKINDVALRILDGRSFAPG
jgi:hypothetical protein